MAKVDTDRFRLRTLIDRLIEAGEVDIHDEFVPLADISGILEGSDKGVLFRNAGAESFEIVGGVSGSRRRLAMAMGVAPNDIALDYLRRMAQPQTILELTSDEAPVHDVIIAGDDVDLTTLPFHLQHQLDGAPYISSAIDFSVDRDTGRRNVGCRRLMLCGRRELRANLTQLSDLRRMYIAASQRGENLPVNFAIGSHPLDLLAASVRLPLDEVQLIGTLRGTPVPMVKAVTNDVLVPADAELVIEGYFDKVGYSEREGPYGELLGYYGAVHDNPPFRVTAITRRHDALHQTVLHGAVRLARTEAAQVGCLLLEARIWEVLRASGLDVAAVNGCAATGGMVSARAAISSKLPSDGRSAVEAMLSVPFLKHAVVTDATVDIFIDEEVEWAMSNRFRADRDLVLIGGQRPFPMEVAVGANETVTKIGYDLTGPLAVDGIRAEVAAAPRIVPLQRHATVRDALADGPQYFGDLMANLGSRDGREIVVALESLGTFGGLSRTLEGKWALKK